MNWSSPQTPSTQAAIEDANSIIELQQCSKHYGKVKALNAINLSVGRGERVVVMGPSGAGKSTLLRVIAGLENCDKGTVLIGGEEANRIPPAARGIAMVTQDYALYPQLSVAKNILASASKRKLSKPQATELLSRLLQDFQLQEVSERRPNELSGGQRQRACFAKALASNPRILLLDEPLSQQDPELAGRARELINLIAGRNELTIVLITHAPLDALQLADRLVILESGTIAECGAPQLIYQNPTSEVSLRLLSPLGVSCIPTQLLTTTDSPFTWLGDNLPNSGKIMFRIEQATSLTPSETPPKKGLVINFKAPTELFTPFGTLVRENLLQVEVKALREFAAPATSRFLVPEEACLLV